jgi:hypothetical protein
MYGPQLELYISVLDYGTGSAPRLHIGTVKRLHSNFISEFFIQTQVKVVPKPWESTIEIEKIPAGETAVLCIYCALIPK